MRSKIRKRKKFFVISVFVLLLICSVFLSSKDVVLGVLECFQEHSSWCWDGGSQAVLEYYGTFVEQCVIANWAWSRSDCCGSSEFYWDHVCNQGNFLYSTSGSVQAILSHWGVSTVVVASSLSNGTAVSELDARRPFVIRFGWASGGGHILVGYGYEDDGLYLNYMDPWPGNGYTTSLYTWVVESPGHHTWTHTLRSTTTPAYAAEILSVSPVDPVVLGGSASLCAEVQNIGTSAFPAGTRVWFYVDGPDWSGDHYVGYTVASGLSPGSIQSYCFEWDVPLNATPGTYSYQAVVKTDREISEWSGTQDFTVAATSLQYTLSIAATSGGTTDPAPGDHLYDSGTVVELEALSDQGYKFSKWTGDIPSEKETDNPVSITMDSDKSVTANFVLDPSQARALFLSPADFNQNQDENDYLLDSKYLYLKNGSSSRLFYAPIHLPQDAKITSIIVFYYDNHNPGNVTATLYKVNAYTEAVISLGTFTSSGVSGIVQSHKISPLIGGNKIDNGGYFYCLCLDFTNASAGENVRIYRVKINYQDS